MTSQPEIVNNLNKTAILAAKAKMNDDPNLGKSAPIQVQAVWKEGVVRDTLGTLVCYPPPEIQKGQTPKGPSLNSYCPMIASGCFSLIMMLQAAERDYHFKSMTSRTTAKANLKNFYKYQVVAPIPWKDGVKLDIVVDGTQSKEELYELAEIAEHHCPSSEIMRREFPVETVPIKVVQLDDKAAENIPVWYDMESYKQIQKTQGPYMVDQEANMVWHCQNENKEYPGSLITFTFPHDANSQLVLSHDAPIGSGKYATPVSGCFFGGLSAYMHTVAARIYDKGFKVESMNGEIRANLNKRKVMAVSKDSYVFPDGLTMSLHVKTNAPEDVIEAIEWEIDDMSPSHLNWKNSIDMKYEVHKK